MVLNHDRHNTAYMNVHWSPQVYHHGALTTQATVVVSGMVPTSSTVVHRVEQSVNACNTRRVAAGGLAASESAPDTLHVWDLASFIILYTFVHVGVRALSWLSDGRLATASHDSELFIHERRARAHQELRARSRSCGCINALLTTGTI